METTSLNPNELKALVLNANYMPVDVFPLMAIPCIPAAVTRCYQAKPTCTVHYDWPVPIKSARADWKYNYPSVIVRMNTNFYHRDGVHLTHETLFYRDEGRCAYCGEYTPIKQGGNRWGQMEHVIPESKGGDKSWENIVWACPKCNNDKGDKDPKGKWKPMWKPWRPTYWELLRYRKKFPLRVQDKRWLEFLPEWKGPVIITKDLDERYDG